MAGISSNDNSKNSCKLSQSFIAIALKAEKVLGPVVQKAVNANPGLKVNQCFCFSSSKAFPLLILSYSLKAAKVKTLGKTKSHKSTSLGFKTEFKTDANPGLA